MTLSDDTRKYNVNPPVGIVNFREPIENVPWATREDELVHQEEDVLAKRVFRLIQIAQHEVQCLTHRWQFCIFCELRHKAIAKRPVFCRCTGAAKLGAAHKVAVEDANGERLVCIGNVTGGPAVVGPVHVIVERNRDDLGLHILGKQNAGRLAKKKSVSKKVTGHST